MEKRFYPRVNKPLSAVVENTKGLNFEGVVVNVSIGGVCIQCNTFERNLITPGGSFVSDGKPVALFVLLKLPFDEGQTEKIEVHCHVVFSRRISHKQCRIGMRYTNLDATAYDLLIKYIESASQGI